MQQEDVSSVLVGRPGELVAILTERDLVDALADGRGPESPVGEVAAPNPLTVPPEESVQQAATLMIRHGIRHLVVASGQRAVGVVSVREALDLLVTASNPQTVFDVVREAIAGPPENWLG
jgi:CBS domain-containing protein